MSKKHAPMDLKGSLKFAKEELVAVLALVAVDEAFMNYDYDGDGHLKFLITCNDTFAYSTGDCEEYPISEAPRLYEIYKRFGHYGLIHDISVKRGEKVLSELQGEIDAIENALKTETQKVSEQLNQLKAQAEPYLNTLVLDLDKVVRLVGVEEKEDDFYWIYDSLTKGVYYSSCVMGWTKLKGSIPDEDYNRLVDIWNLNVEKKVN